MREFVDGATAIARGAIDAGCTFFAGYPITPATPILLHMVRELPKVGGVAIQAEDEMASIGFCIGAAMAGAKVMTATSGPGLSLYSENIGLGIMGEVPMVIVDCQRMGPATGGATTGAQGDVQFIRWGTSGGYPIIALCPTNGPECYSLTIRAFNLAERFRTPVFLVTSKEMVTARTTVEISAYEPVEVVERKVAAEEVEFIPYGFDRLSDVPAMSPFGGSHIVRFTTSSHDERGYMTKDPAKVDRLNRHLAAKIEEHLDEIALVKADMQKGARVLMVSYGITARSMLEAVQVARREGVKVSALTVYSLWPVPEKEIAAALKGIEKVVVPELNLGQYRREIERVAAGWAGPHGPAVVGVNRVDGELISPAEILEGGGIL
ncbi:MAG: 2-oxoacid:acceptor oxidoreductase subunit alpha [Anaerolineae bacterium]